MYRLRELERKDLPIINTWRNNPELISLLGAPYRFINLEVDEKWFDSYMNNRSNTVRCAIVTDTDDAIIGLVTIASINHLNQSGEFHIMIGDRENRGKGAGTFAVTEMLKHAFYNLNLHRIELGALSTNVAAQKLYEKCGFKREGIMREAVYKNGSFVDMFSYAILKNEFVEVSK